MGREPASAEPARKPQACFCRDFGRVSKQKWPQHRSGTAIVGKVVRMLIFCTGAVTHKISNCLRTPPVRTGGVPRQFENCDFTISPCTVHLLTWLASGRALPLGANLAMMD